MSKRPAANDIPSFAAVIASGPQCKMARNDFIQPPNAQPDPYSAHSQHQHYAGYNASSLILSVQPAQSMATGVGYDSQNYAGHDANSLLLSAQPQDTITAVSENSLNCDVQDSGINSGFGFLSFSQDADSGDTLGLFDDQSPSNALNCLQSAIAMVPATQPTQVDTFDHPFGPNLLNALNIIDDNKTKIENMVSMVKMMQSQPMVQGLEVISSAIAFKITEDASTIAKVQESFNPLKKTNEDLVNENTKLKSDLSNFQTALESACKERDEVYKSLWDEHQKAISNHKSELLKASEQRKDDVRTLEKQKGELHSLNQQLSKLKNSITFEKDEMRKEIEKLKNEKGISEGLLSQKSAQVHELKGRVKDLEDSEKQGDELIRKLTEDAVDAGKKIAQLEESAKNFHAEKKQISAQMAEFEQMKAAFKAYIDPCQASTGCQIFYPVLQSNSIVVDISTLISTWSKGGLREDDSYLCPITGAPTTVRCLDAAIDRIHKLAADMNINVKPPIEFEVETDDGWRDLCAQDYITVIMLICKAYNENTGFYKMCAIMKNNVIFYVRINKGNPVKLSCKATKNGKTAGSHVHTTINRIGWTPFDVPLEISHPPQAQALP